jgi:hypothetical protein
LANVREPARLLLGLARLDPYLGYVFGKLLYIAVYKLATLRASYESLRCIISAISKYRAPILIARG